VFYSQKLKASKAWDSWTGDVDGKFSQPDVSGNKFLGYPSFFYSPFSFPPYFYFIRNYSADPSSNPAVGYVERCKLLFQGGLGRRPSSTSSFG